MLHTKYLSQVWQRIRGFLHGLVAEASIAYRLLLARMAGDGHDHGLRNARFFHERDGGVTQAMEGKRLLVAACHRTLTFAIVYKGGGGGQGREAAKSLVVCA